MMRSRFHSLRVGAGWVAGLALGTLFMLARESLLESRSAASGDEGARPNGSVSASARAMPAATAAAAIEADSGAAPATEATAAPPEPKPFIDVDAKTLDEQRRALFINMQTQLSLSQEQLGKIEAIFAASRLIGQGDPASTKHPMTRAECRAIRAQADDLVAGDPRCPAPNMVPIYDPTRGETAQDAKLCIDQYEFPNIPCEYPVVWVRADEALMLCQAEGKRLCDAHEWEGACAGAVLPPDQEYTWGERRLMQEYLHNKSRKILWAYGPHKNMSLCATGSQKSPTCQAQTTGPCGSNTYPAGAFPECKSVFGVYDQHGNAAEHMNLPLTPEELGSRGGSGETEMKGSWFIFASEEAHPDDCRWRGLAWHATRVRDPESHRNYHLGFRCCADLPGSSAGRSDEDAPDAAIRAARAGDALPGH